MDTTAFLRSLAILPIMIDRTPNEAEVLALARRHRLTVHDASYLELAQRLQRISGDARRGHHEGRTPEGSGLDHGLSFASTP